MSGSWLAYFGVAGGFWICSFCERVGDGLTTSFRFVVENFFAVEGNSEDFVEVNEVIVQSKLEVLNR